MVHAEYLAHAQGLGVRVLRRARDSAAVARTRVAGTAEAVMVAIGAATAQRRGVSVARAAPNVAPPLAVLLDAGAAHARELLRVVVAAEVLAPPQRGCNRIHAARMHLVGVGLGLGLGLG